MVADQTSKMFKRPTIKCGFLTPKQFVTEIRPNGTRASTWVTPVHIPAIIPNGTPGRVGEIVDLMYKGFDCVRRPDKTPWTPPMDYEFVAKHLPEEIQDAYLAKCEMWIADNPPRRVLVPAEKPVIDTELILALYKKYPGAVPPFEERMKVCRVAGYSEEYIAKKTERHRKFTELAEERQKSIDNIFGKWPSANKATPKPKSKVIKAVKKRT
jgi:hypothetical protein